MSTIKSQVGISLPMLNQPAARLAELARTADEAGFHSLWDYEFFRNPFITHAVNAGVTSHVKLATASTSPGCVRCGTTSPPGSRSLSMATT